MPPVLLEERVCAFQVSSIEKLLHQAALVGFPKHAGPDGAADGVVHGIAGECRQEQQSGEEPRFERPGGREGACGKEQRVARQERRDDEPGLGEDDREEQAVDPGPVRIDERGQMTVEVDDVINEFGHRQQGHTASRTCAA